MFCCLHSQLLIIWSACCLLLFFLSSPGSFSLSFHTRHPSNPKWGSRGSKKEKKVTSFHFSSFDLFVSFLASYPDVALLFFFPCFCWSFGVVFPSIFLATKEQRFYLFLSPASSISIIALACWACACFLGLLCCPQWKLNPRKLIVS